MHSLAAFRTARQHQWFAVAAIALSLIGLMARLYRLDLMLYDFDEGVASIYALQLVERADFPLFGVRTSLGFYNPPGFIYLIAPAFLICKSPLFAVGLIQVLSVAMFAGLVVYLYRFGWRWGSLAFLAVAMLAPGPLFLCERLWGHALIPVFSCAAVWMVLALVRTPTLRSIWLLLPVIIAGAQQVHFSGALLLLDAAIALAVFRVRPQWKWLLAGFGIATCTYIPFLVFETRTGFADLKAVAATMVGRTSSAEHTALWRAALFSWSDFGGATAFQDRYPQFLSRLPDFWFLRVAGAAAFTCTIVMSLRHLRREPGDDRVRQIVILALVWIVVPFVVFSMLHVVTVPAYWLVALPGPWLAAAFAAESILSRSAQRRRSEWALAGWIGAYALICLRYVIVHNSTVAHADPALVVYPSYRDQYFAVATVCQDSAGRQVQFQQNKGSDAIDYQLLYLVAMIEGNATRLRHPTHEAADLQKYVLTRRDAPMAMGPGWSKLTFGVLDLYIEPLDPHILKSSRGLVFGPGSPANADRIMRFYTRTSGVLSH